MTPAETRRYVVGRARLAWFALMASLWFVPSLMILAGAGLAIALVQLSPYIDGSVLEQYPRIFGAGADSSRDMLGTIAGAMMTIASVTFSITMVAVTQASSQYTPRILRNFMRDRAHQRALGTFTGIFVYCLIVIRTLRGDEDRRFIPEVAVLTAFVLAVVGIGTLVFFIHHVATSLQASTILAKVRDDTIAAVDRLFPEDAGDEADRDPDEVSSEVRWFPVSGRQTGYVTHVDAKGLLDYAERCGTVVRMERGIGEYAVEGTPLLSVATTAPGDEDADSLVALFALASQRTIEQDAGFGLGQMVAIAVKALSPGVNGTSTALTSVDAIGAVLVRLARRDVESMARARGGRVLVIARGPSFASLVSDALDQVRQNAGGNVAVLTRLIQTIELAAAQTTSPRRRALLLSHGARVLALAERSVDDLEDRAAIRTVYDRLAIVAG